MVYRKASERKAFEAGYRTGMGKGAILAGHVYIYEGPVYDSYGNHLGNVSVETVRGKNTSEAKVINNLYYRAKKELGLSDNAAIRLDDDLIDSVYL